MKKLKLMMAIALAGSTPLQSIYAAETVGEALKASTVFGDFRLRYEDVEAGDNSSDGLTLRSRLGFKSDKLNGFSATLELEDVRNVLAIDDEGNLIPDPQVTEIDQGFIQYQADDYTAKLGRQVIALDGQRFVGHVGWRQDRQTFDAFRAQLSPIDKLTVDISYIYKRNRIFAEDKDADASDVLLNSAYSTPLGKVVGYAYLLDDDELDTQSDTYGLSLAGASAGELAFSYLLEFASQSIALGAADYDTEYRLIELGARFSAYTAKLGYEVLGSDDGEASFTTPLATLHKFNGWNDIFLGGTFNPTAMPNGLEDSYVSLATTVSGAAVVAVFHDYSSDNGSSDYGTEAGLLVSRSYKNGVSVGMKYSTYKADDFAADSDKLWLWSGYKF